MTVVRYMEGVRKILSFTILGQLPGLNEYTQSNRNNKYGGNKLKQDTQKLIGCYIPKEVIRIPIFIEFHWYEPNKKRDKDNVAFAKKFILDCMVKSGIIQNDGWKEVIGFSDYFGVDKDNPRVEVIIKTEV